MERVTLGFFSFKKKKSDEAPKGEEAKSSAAPEAVEDKASKKSKADANVPDPRKARRFYDYAQTVTDARNYDYAIVCWVNGLKHDPENMSAHEKLRDVALRRMVSGGKPAGGREKKNAPTGKQPSDKVLAAEFLWSHDPINPALGIQVMELAYKADMDEMAYWVGKFVVEANDSTPKPNKHIYERVKKIYAEMKAWDLAAGAQQRIVTLDPTNMVLMHELKQLEAEATVQKGGYGESGTSFRSGIKDAEKQKALEDADAIAATDVQIEANITRTRQEFDQDPDNMDKLGKLVRALLANPTESTENEAIGYLKTAFDKSGVYRLKMQVGDIRMKQFQRKLKELRKAAEAAHVDTTKKKLAEQFHALRAEQLEYEQTEYEERCKNYPTQMELRFQLGLRQFLHGDMDKAIGSFQEAQADAKTRGQALRYLGEAFLRKHLFDEAIDTFRRASEAHPVTNDKLGMELRYFLMLALEAKAKRDKSARFAEEAQKVASQIAQADYNYKDIRHHIDNLRKLAEQFRGV